LLYFVDDIVNNVDVVDTVDVDDDVVVVVT
jgi:hypothetical protein